MSIQVKRIIIIGIIAIVAFVLGRLAVRAYGNELNNDENQEKEFFMF